jgi:phytoene desaturase
MPKTAIVIGAGVGGLATAIRLACKGYAVQVFEANAFPGGKLSEFQAHGYRFDAGPSLFTMPHLVDELFTLAGENAREHFQYQPLEVACQYFWPDGTALTAWQHPDRFAAEAQRVLGVPDQRITSALHESARLWHLTADIFLERSLHRLGTYVRWKTARSFLLIPTMGMFSSLNRVNTRRLKHPKLVQLFNRYATYNGSDPYRASGILAVIPHLEHGLTAALPVGGMVAIAQSLHQLAERKGVQFHFNTPAERIVVQGKRAVGVVAGGQQHTAQVVVSNQDVVPTYRRLLPDQPQPERILRQERSSSALIFYWGVRATFPQLHLHNIFFSEDYPREFSQIFGPEAAPTDPTVYLNITSKYEPTDAPPGCENWFILVNVGPNTGQNWAEIAARTRAAVLAKLSRMLGQAIEPLIETEQVLDPVLIEQRTSSYQGALYGTSSNTRSAAFFRHPNFSRRIRGLYFVGGSVHPGGGIPLCLHSARIVGSLVP